METSNWLIPLLLLVPLITALGMLVPNPWFDDRRNAWAWTLVSTVVTFVLSLVVAFQFDWSEAGIQMASEIRWIPEWGLTFGFGLDTISLWLVLLTTFLMPIVILGSLTAVEHRAREFYFWLLVLQAAMTGVFLATDIIFFYICFEFTLIPLYFLIGVFGSRQRLAAAKMFFLYTFTGSMLTLAGLLYVAFLHADATGAWSFAIADLYETAQGMNFTQQAFVLGAMLAGFAVKVPLWPVHTWLPLAHTEAPTAGSVVLAGVLLKLGTYALLRFALPMTPEAVVVFAPYIGVLAVIGILYTALVCWVQKDIKKLIAYSSVSHLGFCVLGLFALDANDIGAVGAVMYMINHGLSTGALFLCVGMIYERFHTREMALMSGLARVMPVWATFMGFFVMASVGLPGLNGFVSEFLTLAGTFLSPTGVLGIPYAFAAGAGMILAAIYLLYMMGKVVFGPTRIPPHDDHDDHHAPVKDLNTREIATLAPLAVACLVFGILPFPILQSLEPSVGNMTAAAKAEVERLTETELVEANELIEETTTGDRMTLRLEIE
ncbi:NuoM family protein [Phycisphaerales bacterium AB-hyl4]|uniref:NuoM family protein n=1 Tax=Natronomicrosphaera hydrolytica TaxID=3242702 RepID=A0ABV4U165_9BACT